MSRCVGAGCVLATLMVTFGCGGGSARRAAPEEAAGSERAPLVVSASMKLDVGQLPAVTNAWTTVTLPSTYASMVVVATPAYGASSPPLVTRIRNTGASSFDVRVDRFDG